jgi:hypothetical protein
MRIPRSVLMVVVSATIGGLGGTWVFAQQQRRAAMLSPEDYLEIQQLYYTYSRDVDPGSERDASWMYTPDGTFGAGANARRGEKALKEFYTQVRSDQYAGVRHFTSNLLIVPTPEGARTSSYMMIVERKDQGGPVLITGFGKYDDTLVKTPAGWRFKERVFRPDSWRSAPRN